MAKHSKILHRSLSTRYETAASAEGCYVRDAQGKQYVDASGGAAVSCLGHGHPRVLEAMKRQMEKLQFIHSSFFTSDAAEALAERLAAAAPGGAWRVFFVSGGSEATEAALKLSRQLWVERGEPQRDHFFARWQSYHGNTLGALSVSGNKGRRALYDPLLLAKARLALPCFAYRHKAPQESEADYAGRTAASLDEAMVEAGRGRAIGFIAETVVGATLGAAPAVPGYFKRIREICDRHGAFFVADEVMCGMGRCGAMFAIEEEAVQPDMITLAKGLGGGYQPIGALLVREALVEELMRGSGAFQHGHTYIGHAIAAAAALEVQKVIAEERLVERARRMGALLKERLEARFGAHPHVGDIRGRGLFLALELVEERESKRPFPAKRKLWAKIKAAGLEEGLICYPSGGTADGVNGDHVLLAPPYIVEDAQLDEIVEKLARAIDRGIEKTM
ncbi:MAG TPA: aspartate aminotransferase family protein [Aestuariivirgaceae bacterium]|jgi:adenosylmethionine-8-amino-7-oxononanoate aminotransferase